MDCQTTGNPKTGEAAVRCGVNVGNDQINGQAGVFASTPGGGGPVTKGVYGAVNGNGHSLSIQHGHTEHFGSTTTARANANLLQQPNGTALNANAYHSHSKSYDQFGGGLNLQTSGGHAASVGVNRIPQFDVTTMNATGSANLYTSPSGNMNLNAVGNASRHMSGPLRGKSDFGGGMNFRYNF